MTGHTDNVYSVSFSPDGKYALSASWDETLKYWDLSTGDCKKTMNTEHRVYSVSGNKMFLDIIYPNGGEKFTADSVKVTMLWDTFGAMDSVLVELTTDAAKSWNKISKTENNCTYEWSLPEASSSECKIRLTGFNNGFPIAQDECDEFFEMNTIGFKKYMSANYLPFRDFSASPNPFTDRLTISLPSSGAIYSLTGQLIINLSKGKHSLDTSKWREGVYIIKSNDKSKRIIKM